MTAKFGDEFRAKDVYSSHLTELIEVHAADPGAVDLVRELRDVEKELRNPAAHQIVSITEDSIKREFGFSAKHIMDSIKKAFVYAGFNIKKEQWSSYDEMNEVIIKAIEG